MFADDTNLFVSGRSVAEITQEINKELSVVAEWFQANLLSLNVKKTSYLIFGNKNVRDLKLNISIQNTFIEKQNETKFLGVILSDDLRWNKHVNAIVHKISKTIGIISKVRHLLPRHSTRTLYLTLVEPYINYCNIIWAGPQPTTLLDKIMKIQKKYCRLITFSDYRSHTKELFTELNFLDVYKIYTLQLSLYMYKITNTLSPGSEIYNFHSNSLIHSHNTRHKSNIHVEYCRTKYRQNTVRFQGPKLWNSLPMQLKSVRTIFAFKNKIKKLLISNEITTVWIIEKP
jgi:hypothetical protein